MSSNIAHRFVYKFGDSQHRGLLYCEKCGYVAFYAGDSDYYKVERQKNLPPSCTAEWEPNEKTPPHQSRGPSGE